MNAREYGPLLAVVLVALALSTGAATFDSVERLDGADGSGATHTPRESAPGPKESAPRENGGSARSGLDGGGESDSRPEETDTSRGDSPLVIFLVVVGVTGAFLVVGHVAAGEEEQFEGEEDRERSVRDAPAVVREPDPEDGVAAAWLRFARRVDDEWWRSTPGETAATARARGFPERAVCTLRETFERVRYGEAKPTAEHERRAREALEAVEREWDSAGSVEGESDDVATADRESDDDRPERTASSGTGSGGEDQ